MEKKFIYEGKAKILYSTPEGVIVHFKDDVTAFNGEMKDTINNKGILNNSITTIIYNYLTENNIPNHFIKKLDEREQLCIKTEVVPLEVIVRNKVAGSMAKRYGLQEGMDLETPVFELSYKNDDLNDPLINDHHVLALNLCSKAELDYIYKLAGEINQLLISLFDKIDIALIDMKFEFGRTAEHEIILIDEITPDTCRLWDKTTMKKLDKDRYRRSLGNVEESYVEVLSRMEELCLK